MQHPSACLQEEGAKALQTLARTWPSFKNRSWSIVWRSACAMWYARSICCISFSWAAPNSSSSLGASLRS